MPRPSNKELSNKLRAAKTAVHDGNVFLIDQDVMAQDAIELGFDIHSELLDVLKELLNEISVKQYAGSRPPQKSYERDIEGLELFPFVAESSRFKHRVYLKFALAEGSFWLVSLHTDRPQKEEK